MNEAGVINCPGSNDKKGKWWHEQRADSPSTAPSKSSAYAKRIYPVYMMVRLPYNSLSLLKGAKCTAPILNAWPKM